MAASEDGQGVPIDRVRRLVPDLDLLAGAEIRELQDVVVEGDAGHLRVEDTGQHRRTVVLEQLHRPGLVEEWLVPEADDLAIGLLDRAPVVDEEDREDDRVPGSPLTTWHRQSPLFGRACSLSPGRSIRTEPIASLPIAESATLEPFECRSVDRSEQRRRRHHPSHELLRRRRVAPLTRD